ncbi:MULTISPECIES: phage tail assembly protein T [Actinobacillus]|nr:DUF4035 domain-containing protein [Actinobacillus suis]EFM95294.1 hypothetical protein appser10_21540 [Actinobacillus pleuropneumoniae serovar 10 str. D13039]
MALGKTLSEIELMPESHLQEYEMFYAEQPFGLFREDYRMAQLLQLIAIVNKDKNTPTPDIQDFMPFFKSSFSDDNEEDGQTLQDFLAQRQEQRL